MEDEVIGGYWVDYLNYPASGPNYMVGLDYTINRFFSVYGVGMDCEGAYTEVIFNWLNNIKNKITDITVFGDPNEKILDLVYIDDVVDAIILTTFNSNKQVNKVKK